ncbi:MAG TPA: DUF2207 domain-containing protein [bacterium]|nr:DUF2207 domain-containing protein [bacterium]
MTRWILILIVVALVAPAAAARSYAHPLIEQTFRLRPDGSAEVEEVRAFRFDGAFSWATITRTTRGQYGRYGLVYTGVWDAQTGQALRYQVEREGDNVTLRWFYQAQNTTKRFRLRYRIERAVQRYADVAQFYWQAVEGDHAPIGRVRIVIEPPRPSIAVFKVFVHSRAAPGTLDLAPDRSRAEVTQAAIPATSFVEVRALLDPALFPQTPLLGGQDYARLLEDERQQAAPTLRPDRLVTPRGVLAGLLVLLLIGGFIWTYLRYGREPAVGYDARYEREPPRPLPPAVVPAIMSQGSVARAQLPRAFAATLLEAARLGYLEIEETQDQGVLGTGLLKDGLLVYRLTEKGQALLAGSPAAPEQGERTLEPFETAVLEAVFKQAGASPAVDSKQIEAWGKRIVGSKSNFLRFIQVWGPQLRGWFEQRFFKLDDSASERARVSFVGATIAVLAAVFFVGSALSLLVAIPIGGGLIALAAGLSRRTPQAALEVRRWEAFRRFMTDFSAMKDAGPQLLHLWEHYLVYAVALGVADRLLSNLTLVAAELHQPVSSPRWFRSPPAGWGLAGSGGSLESLTRSFQNFQNLSRALSSSTGSGGGFSGGGGGGGGGGASRAG